MEMKQFVKVVVGAGSFPAIELKVTVGSDFKSLGTQVLSSLDEGAQVRLTAISAEGHSIALKAIIFARERAVKRYKFFDVIFGWKDVKPPKDYDGESKVFSCIEFTIQPKYGFPTVIHTISKYIEDFTDFVKGDWTNTNVKPVERVSEKDSENVTG